MGAPERAPETVGAGVISVSTLPAGCDTHGVEPRPVAPWGDEFSARRGVYAFVRTPTHRGSDDRHVSHRRARRPLQQSRSDAPPVVRGGGGDRTRRDLLAVDRAPRRPATRGAPAGDVARRAAALLHRRRGAEGTEPRGATRRWCSPPGATGSSRAWTSWSRAGPSRSPTRRSSVAWPTCGRRSSTGRSRWSTAPSATRAAPRSATRARSPPPSCSACPPARCWRSARASRSARPRYRFT